MKYVEHVKAKKSYDDVVVVMGESVQKEMRQRKHDFS